MNLDLRVAKLMNVYVIIYVQKMTAFTECNDILYDVEDRPDESSHLDRQFIIDCYVIV